MIKAILYRSFQEKAKLEREMFSKIPITQRVQRAAELGNLMNSLNNDRVGEEPTPLKGKF